MFPFAGLLNSISSELNVPGQGAGVIWNATAGGFEGGAVSGIYFQTNGDLKRRFGSFFVSQANMWVSDDAIGVVNGALYECGYFNVTGNLADLSGPATGTWHPINTERGWFVSALGGSFDYVERSVSGAIQIREIANTSNLRSGSLTLKATWEGQN